MDAQYYDDLCSSIAEQEEAQSVILIVLGGKRGSGYSRQIQPSEGESLGLPNLLRHLADEIERDLRGKPSVLFG